MADITISDVGKVSREELASHILSGPTGLAIIDVRDSDFIGGHIIGCQNVPTNTFDYRMPELVRTLKDKETVVFHCALSQQRGPQSALRYLRERERLSKHLADNEGQVEGKTKQQVLILEGGFVKWQEKYGEDERLTEGYRKDVWQDGY